MPTDDTLKENQYGGLNQRTYPTLLDDNVFAWTDGVTYRSGKAARINGKQSIYYAATPVLAILQTLNGFIVQTYTKLLFFPTNLILPIPSESNTLQSESGSYLQAENQSYLQFDN
jgi:hypothetical protein